MEEEEGRHGLGGGVFWTESMSMIFQFIRGVWHGVGRHTFPLDQK